MKVRIDAGGRQVEIECGDAGTSYRELADKALEVWNRHRRCLKLRRPRLRLRLS